MQLFYEGNINILVLKESRIDSGFPNSQFEIGFLSPYRFDRNKFVGGTLHSVNTPLFTGGLTFLKNHKNGGGEIEIFL